MAVPTITTFTPNTTISSSEMNTNLANLKNRTDTPLGNRQGGSADDFLTAGTNTYSETGLLTQMGTIEAAFSNVTYKIQTVTFPIAFSAGKVPIILLTVGEGTHRVACSIDAATAPTNTGFSVIVYVTDISPGGTGGTAVTFNCPIVWMAIGTKT